jgi:hypothetical protein
MAAMPYYPYHTNVLIDQLLQGAVKDALEKYDVRLLTWW